MSTTKKRGGLLSRIKKGAASLRSGLKRRRQRGKEKRATARGRRAKAKQEVARAGVEQLETTKRDIEQQLTDPGLTPEERLLLRTQLQEVNRELTRGRFFVVKQEQKRLRAKKKKVKARTKLGVPQKSASATAPPFVPQTQQLPLESPEPTLGNTGVETEQEKGSRIESRIRELTAECEELKNVLSHVNSNLNSEGSYETQREWYDVKKLVQSHLQENLKKIACKRCKRSKHKKRWYDRREGVYPSSFANTSASIQYKTGGYGATVSNPIMDAARSDGYAGMMVLDMKTGKFVSVE